MDDDRERWNARWRERAGELEDASAFIAEQATYIPSRGRALDIAGGAGRNAIWLARRGLDVSLVDVSDVALDKAEARAKRLGLASSMRFLRVDLEGPLPFAPLFDLIAIVHYLDRERRDTFAELLVEGGVLLAANPTVTNLERHARPRVPCFARARGTGTPVQPQPQPAQCRGPGATYLVERGELARWVCDLGMDLLSTREDWNDEGIHEASVIGRKPPRAPARDPEPSEPGPTSGPYR